MSAPRNAARGFTLTEILIVIVIVGILTTLAVPSYRQYVQRTNRTVAKASLQELMTRQESYAVDHKRYADKPGMLGVGAAGNTLAYVASDGVIGSSSSGALYQITLQADANASCAAPSGVSIGTTVALKATPVTAATDTVCGTLCLSSSGVRGSTVGTATECWKR